LQKLCEPEDLCGYAFSKLQYNSGRKQELTQQKQSGENKKVLTPCGEQQN